MFRVSTRRREFCPCHQSQRWDRIYSFVKSQYYAFVGDLQVGCLRSPVMASTGPKRLPLSRVGRARSRDGLGIRFRRSSRNPHGLENDLLDLEPQGNIFPSSGIQGQAEAVVVRAVRWVVRVAVRRPAIRRVVVPPPAPPCFISLRQNRSAIRLRHLRSPLRGRSVRASARRLRSLLTDAASGVNSRQTQGQAEAVM